MSSLNNVLLSIDFSVDFLKQVESLYSELNLKGRGAYDSLLWLSFSLKGDQQISFYIIRTLSHRQVNCRAEHFHIFLLVKLIKISVKQL